MTVETILLPALSIVASAATSVAALRYQQRTSELARLWERRAELYVDLLEHRHSYLAAPDMDPASRPYFGPQTREEQELLRSLSARVDAFATEPVAKLWRDALMRAHGVSSFVTEGMSDPRFPTAEEEAQITPLLEQQDAADNALRKQIRHELKTDRRPPTLRSRRQGEPSVNRY